MLGVTSPKRIATMPDVPTVSEGGVNGYVEGNWQGVLVPARDSTAIGEALVGLLADRERLDRLGREGRSRYEEHFRLERMVRQTVYVYERSMGAR